MKKIALFVIILFFPVLSYGAVHYTRSPSGSEIRGPVTFTISVDSEEDFGLSGDPEYIGGYWGVQIIDTINSENVISYCNIATSTLSHTFVVDFPDRVWDFGGVLIGGTDDPLLCPPTGNGAGTVIGATLEGDYDCEGVCPIIFTITGNDETIVLPSLTVVASETFESVMGFSWNDIVTYSADNIKLVVGSGLGVLFFILPWIIAIVVFSTGVLLIYTAFRFFRH